MEDEVSNSPGPNFIQLNEVMQVAEVDKMSTDLDQQDRQNDEETEEERRYKTCRPIAINLNEELKAGYKILTGLMAWSHKHVNWPFMDSIENTDPELNESYSFKIEKPMWLKKMKEKFESYEYNTITEFVADFRLMLENCYHFNGPDHFVSKRAVKLETMLEQKLALLSRDIREKTTIAATSGQREEENALGLRRRPKSHIPHNSSLLMNQLREEQIQKKKERRRKMILDRRAEREALAQEITSWEKEVLFAGQLDHMKAMWEIPQIGLFLFLLQDPLNVGEVMHFELERSFMMPRESSTIHRIMTSLLSTPFQRLKIDKKTVMPYSVWEAKLRYKLQVWYKIYNDCNRNVERTCLKLGLEEQFFDVVGYKNPLERKKFHEISFYRRVWIMKALCDHCLHMQETLRDMIELQPFEDQRELVLGTDSAGQRYIHFPQFCGADIRIYRQAPIKYPKIEIKPDPFESKRKFPFVYRPPPRKKVKLKKKNATPSTPVKQVQQEKSSPCSSPLRQRPSRLRQAPKAVVPLQLNDDTSMTEETNSDANFASDSDTHVEGNEEINYDDPQPGPSGLHIKPTKNDLSDVENDQTSDGQASSASEATIPYCDNSDSNSNVSSRNCSRDSSPSPYPSGRDLRSRFFSHDTRSSDASREASPCISPADFIPRRSARLDRCSDASRDPSPLIFDTDFGLRRGRRRGTALKNMPPYNAARDLSSFLFDDNSNSSAGAGENSVSGQGSNSFWQEKLGISRQASGETGEESNSCDISNLFSNYKDSLLSTGDTRSVSEQDNETMDTKTEDNKIIDGNVDKVTTVNNAEPCSNSAYTEMSNAMQNEVNDDSITDTNISTLSSHSEHSEQSESQLTALGESSESIPLATSLSRSNDISGKSLTVSDEHQNPPTNSKTNDHDDSTILNNGTEAMEVETGALFDDSEASDSRNMVKEHFDFTPIISAMDGRKLDLTGNLFNEEESDSCHTGVESDIDSYVETGENGKGNIEKVNTFNEDDNDKMEELENKSNGSSEISIKQQVERNGVTVALDDECDKNDDDDSVKELHVANDNQGHNTETLEENGTLVPDENSEVVENETSVENCEVNNKEHMASIESEANLNFNKITDDPENEIENEDKELVDLHKSEEGDTEEELVSESQNNQENSLTGCTSLNGETCILDTTNQEPESLLNESDTHSVNEPVINDKTDKDITEDVKSETDKHDISNSVDKTDDTVNSDKKTVDTKLANIKKEPITDDDDEDNDVEKLPDQKQFMMVADSVAELRKLTESFAEPEPIILRRGKKEVVQKMPPRKKNVVLLHERLLCLLKELEPWEYKLQQATRNARIRLRREMEDYEEPPKDKAGGWNTTDEEETESGTDSEQEDEKPKPKLPTSENNSRASTPVKPPIDDNEEIDISQRGRLRKRRIIPNNVEDQYAAKKSRPLKTESSQTTDAPIIVQQSKTELVDYADIIRQLKNNPGIKPILIKTSQGGRTVLTSVMPVMSNTSGTGAETIRPSQNVQTFRFATPTVGGVGIRPDVPRTSPSVDQQGSTKLSQHPTIRTLLSASLSAIKPPLQPKPAGDTSPHPETASSVMSTGQNIPDPSHIPVIKVFKTHSAAASKPSVPGQAGSVTSPESVVNSGAGAFTIVQCSAQKKTATSPAPRKIAPRTVVKEVRKYFAADASNLPPDVRSQLIATKGAQMAPGKKSILLIPLDGENQSKNTIPQSPLKQATSPVGASLSVETSQVSTKQEIQQSVAGGTPTKAQSVPGGTPTKSSMGHLILPKLPITAAVPALHPGVLGIQGAIVTQTPLHQGVLSGLNVNLSKLALPSSISPPRYPSNETVRTLLDKRKSTDEKKLPYKYMKLYLNTTKAGDSPVATHLVSATTPVTTTVKITTETNLSTAKQETLTHIKTEPVLPLQPATATQNLASAIKAQQCVITSISPAKLNTLLLQTSAAGAKSIPSLIKLPSKAALDSAVKTVVTSVNTTLPTINIKVPSPTSLPSISPRRNVTKTIQTMKSPIPVAPKLITQSSGRSLSSTAGSSAPQLMVVSSLPGQSVVAGQTLSAGSIVQGEVSAVPTGIEACTSGQETPTSSCTYMVTGKDGKKVMTKFTPHLLITSKGVMQVGYLSPDGMLLSNKTKTISGVPLSSSETVLSSAVTSPRPVTITSQANMNLESNTPVIALNASGNPIGTIRRSSVNVIASQSSHIISPTLMSSSAQGNAVPNFNLVLTKPGPQEALNPALKSPALQQLGLVSPTVLGMNLRPGLVLPSGVQVANPLGLQLVQTPLGSAVHAPQNSNMLQTVSSTSPIRAPNMANPAVVFNSGSAGVGLLRTLGTAGSVVPLTSSQQTNLASVATPTLQIPGSSRGLASMNPQQLNLVRQLSATPQGTGDKQVVFQYPSVSPQLAALHPQGSVAALPSPDMKLPINTGNGLNDSAASLNLQVAAQVPAMKVIRSSLSGVTNEAQPSVAVSTSSRTGTLTQQKLLLFSIGGQLVTGQGVPVTLSNGLLKVLPQGKVRINNQTLTQEQVKLTLAKMNDAASSSAVSTGSSAAKPGVNNDTSMKAQTLSSSNSTYHSGDVKLAANHNLKGVSTRSLAEFTDVMLDTVTVKPCLTVPRMASGTSADHDYQSKHGSQHMTGHETSDVALAADYTNVVFDHNNVPVKIERHSQSKRIPNIAETTFRVNENSRTISVNHESLKQSVVKQENVVSDVHVAMGNTNPNLIGNTNLVVRGKTPVVVKGQINSVGTGNTTPVTMGYTNVAFDHNNVPMRIERHPNPVTMGYTNVVFDHNNVPVRIERHPAIGVSSNSESSAFHVNARQNEQLNTMRPNFNGSSSVSTLNSKVHDSENQGYIVVKHAVSDSEEWDSDTNSVNGENSKQSSRSSSRSGSGMLHSGNAVKLVTVNSDSGSFTYGTTVNGRGDASGVKVEIKEEKDDEDSRLIIDDQSGTDNEAAINLLALANQELRPLKVKIEENSD